MPDPLNENEIQPSGEPASVVIASTSVPSVPEMHSVMTPEAMAHRIAAEAERRKILLSFYQEQMKDGTDYGRIMIGGRPSKPSLFKPGSEKFLSLMGLRAVFKRDDDTWEMAGKVEGLFCYVCHLLDGHDRVVGEGRGAADLKKNQGDVNKAIKMASKSAMIDAVLRTGGLSDLFTQDLENMDRKALETPQSAPQGQTAAFESMGDFGEAPDCPAGHGQMRLQMAKKGKNAGNHFWGCPQYPDCKNTKPAAIQNQTLPLEEPKEEDYSVLDDIPF